MSPDEAEFVIDHAKPPYPQMIGDGKRIVIGQTRDGFYAQVVYVLDPEGSAYVIQLQAIDRR